MRVNPSFLKCVLFVGFNDNNDQTKFVGTAFFIAKEDGNHHYLVTAKHVIVGIETQSKDKKVLLRVNQKDGTVRIIETNSNDWLFTKSIESIDVAVLPWDSNEISKSDYLLIPQTILIHNKMHHPPNINVGDDVFLTGLFVSHFGTKRNVPVIRMGSIAMMPEEPVSTKFYGEIEAFLVELRSTGGLSGSPVFVRGALPTPDNTFLLGLIHGHWDSKDDGAPDVAVVDTLLKPVNMGMAIVIPSWKILEVVNQNAKLLGIE